MEGELEVTTSIREEDNKTEVSVVVPADEVKGYIDAVYKRLGKNRIKGFRPGKAPRKVLDQTFGGHDAVMAEATNDLVNDLAPRAVDGQDLIFITDPEFGDTENVAEGEDFTFTVAAKVKPKMQLLTADPVSIELPPEEATDAEIDAQVEGLRSYYYEFEDVEAREVVADDYVSIDLECKAGDEPVQGMNNTERLVKLGEGTLPTDLEAEVVGMKPGDTKEFDFSIEGEEDFAYLNVDELHAVVTVKSIKEEVLPPLDEAFAERIGVESIEALRNMMREVIDGQKKEQLPQLKERRCLDELAKRLHGEVPVAYVNYMRQEVLREFYTNLQRQGATMDQFLEAQGVTMDDFTKDVEDEANEVAAHNLALDALFEELGLEVTEDDVRAEFDAVDNPEETYNQWVETGHLSEIREAVRRQKATEWLLETAVVTEQTLDDEDEDEE